MFINKPIIIEKRPRTIATYQKKIEDGFRDIFQTQTLRGNQTFEYGGFNGFMTIVKEPLVKQQIIQLAKLCQEIPANITIKCMDCGLFIEFWE